MDVETKNLLLSEGKLDTPRLFPKLEELMGARLCFDFDFGLANLPEAPGFLTVRGARQLGKSSWLEMELKKSVERFGAGTAFYLNGDFLTDQESLYQEIRKLLARFTRGNGLKRLFIDEISSINDWQKAIKRLWDMGETQDVLFVTTGSKVVDLQRAAERLPGRKGRLDRTEFLFLPVSFAQFAQKCGQVFSKSELLNAYLLSGGSPLAINELVTHRKIPEYLIQLTKDWILGECAAQKRSRTLLNWATQELSKRGGHPVSLSKLAKECRAANNSVMQGYIDLLRDVLCLSICSPIDPKSGRPIPRKESKYHWIYLLAAVSFDPRGIRSLEDFAKLPREELGIWYEWLVAAHLWRRAAKAGESTPDQQYFWRSSSHEIDFVPKKNNFIEVKLGPAATEQFTWFPEVFPKKKLNVVNERSFQGQWVEGTSFEAFLSEEEISRK